MLGMTLLLVGFYVVLRILYPTEKLKQMAIEMVAEGANRRLELGDTYIHLLHGFVFNDVRLTLPADTIASGDVFPIRYAYFRKIEMQYSLRQILKRRILINKINIESPELEIFVDMETPSAIDLAELIRTDTGFNLHLNELSFQDAKFKIILGYSQLVQNIHISHLSCYLEQIQLPRGGLVQNDSLFQANIKVVSKNCKLLIEQINRLEERTLSATGTVNLKAEFEAKSLADLKFDFDFLMNNLMMTDDSQLGLTQYQIDAPLNINLGLHADAKREAIWLDSLCMDIDGRTWLRLVAQVDSLSSIARFKAKVEKSRIPIMQLLDLTQEWLPESFVQRFKPMNQNASLSLAGSSANGSLQGDMNFAARVRLLPTGFVYRGDSLHYFIAGFSLDVGAQGLYSSVGLQSIGLNAQTRFDTLDIRLLQQPYFYSGGGSLSAEIDLNSQLVPTTIKSELQVDNLLGAQLLGGLELTSKSTIHNMAGSGFVRLYDLDLSRIPDTHIKGDAAMRFTVAMQTLDDINAQLSLNTGSLTVAQEDEPLIFSPANFTVRSRARLDSSFKIVRLDSLRMELNKIFAAKLIASISLSDPIQAWLNLEDFTLNHQAMMDFVPETIRERISEPQLLGSTHIKAEANLGMKREDLDYRVKGHLYTQNTSYYAPAQFLAIVGLDLNADFAVDSQTGGEVGFKLHLDSLRNSTVGAVSFANNRLHFNAKSVKFSTLELRDGMIELPDLFAIGKFSGRIENLTGSPSVDARFHLQQDVRDTLHLPMNMRMIGKSDLDLDFQMDSTRAIINANILTNALSLFLSKSTAIQDVNARLSISQDIDLKQGRLVGSPHYTVLTPSSALMDYLVYRDYYHAENLPLSRITIARIDFADYRIEDISLDLFYKESRLEISALMAKMYGGNVAGRLALDLAQGELNRASYTVNAHFANINSNLILPKRKRDTQEGIINGNLDLHGSGLDPESEFDIQGQVYFTEIGPRVADNILRSLDPQGKDSGIRTTRMLINRGFKPELMTFILRHGYLYPTIIFNQPWYLPVRLSGGKVELARIPLEFFIKSTSPSSIAP
ncbi:hypothetical protein JXO59_15885 [candidate division KSB1 bacterium]|nr:hypothetical protein [candidate division KSB1 bacterium]